jgi:hypothetical protein
MLKAGGEQFSDSVSLSIEKWPSKLQHLDIDGNSLTSLQPILGVCGCEVIRYFDVCAGNYAPSRLIRDDRQMAWIAYHFPFLERLNRDVVTEKFNTVSTVCFLWLFYVIFRVPRIRLFLFDFRHFNDLAQF